MSFARSCALCILLLIFTVPEASGQILNTLSGFEDRDGWQGEAGGYFRLSGGNTEVQDYVANATLQWERGRNRARAIAGYSQTRSNGIDTSEDVITHLRHNFRIREWLSSLAFAQWQHNPFQDLRLRQLVGAGLRFDLIRGDPRRLSVGISAMYEREELTDAGRSDTTRLSSFVDFHRDLRHYMRIGIVGWYQPDLGNFRDLRVSVLADLDVDLAGPLALVLGSTFEYDSRPPAGVVDHDWQVRTGLRLTL